MKEYRLAAWPELRGALDRTAYRRMLNDMSHRHMSVAQLVECSGLRRHSVQAFVDRLEAKGLLNSRTQVEHRVRDAVGALMGWPARTWRAAMRGD